MKLDIRITPVPRAQAHPVGNQAAVLAVRGPAREGDPVPEVYRIPPDLVVCFPGGPVAERAAGGVPVAITHDTLAVLTACRDGAAAADVTARLTAGGYDATEEQVGLALGALAEAGLLCAEDGDGDPSALSSRITRDAIWGLWGAPAWYFHWATRDGTAAGPADIDQLRNDPGLAMPLFKRYPRAARTPLPEPARLPPEAFGQVLAGRRTIREFTGQPVTAQQISQLLYHAHAPHHLVHAGAAGWLPRRAWANGGARSELEIYLAVRGADGLYHYQSAGHYLEILGPPPDTAALLDLCWQQDMCAAAPVTVFITAVPGRVAAKYRAPRALRVIYHDAGCIAQVLTMTATCLGLGAYITAAFRDTAAEQLIGVDGIRETALLILGAGVPAAGTSPETTRIADPPTVWAAGLFDDTGEHPRNPAAASRP